MADDSGPTAGHTAQREAQVRAERYPRITLLRHGEPDWSPGGGPAVSDPELTPFGRAQARAAGAALTRHGIDALYVSPTRRSRQTAAPLAEATGLTPIVIEGLAEIETGAEGLPRDAVDRYFQEGTRRPLAEHWDGWPGAKAERFHDFHQRVTRSLTEVLAHHDARAHREHDFSVWRFGADAPRIAIVAHCGTNAVALTHLLDVRAVPWEWLRFESELAAYSVVQARPLGPSGSVWSLQKFNETDHLGTPDVG